MKIDDNKTYIIAEIGVNHNGSMEIAKQLVDAAASAKVDSVKFQTFTTAKLLGEKKVEKAPYQSRDKSKDQYEMLKKLELSFNDFKELKEYSEVKGLDFISTPYDNDSIDLLEKLGVKIYKIASADIVNRPLIERLLETKKPLILSTGMATLDEVGRTIEFIREKNPKLDLYILHCTTSYPTPYEDVNMKFVDTLKTTFELPVGYSDHTIGLEIPFLAVAMGAKIIEKHFTIDRNMPGPDHFASIEPDDLKLMVNGIRNIEKAIGIQERIISNEELKNKNFMRRSIHLSRNIENGTTIELDDLMFTRPLDGIEVWDYDKVIGKKINKNKSKGDPLLFEDLS